MDPLSIDLEESDGVTMKHPPYHLRTNKAVDRLLFVNVLREFGRDCKGFTYYSLAGPFLEDLRVMDHFFPDMQLVSLESNAQTVKRQEFHRFARTIVLHNVTLREFLTRDYQPSANSVFWLDYTSLRFPLFEDFQMVLKAVLPNSVVRITLRAEPEIDLSVLADRLTDEEIVEIRDQLQRDFEGEFEGLVRHPLPDIFGSRREFVRTVQIMVRNAASRALDYAGSDVDFLPLQSTYYDDHTQMLSVTGVVCNRGQVEDVQTELAKVRFANFDWSEPTKIDIPALSLKERLLLENYLPVPVDQDAGEELCKVLAYKIHDSEKAHKRSLAHYADCYRDYPNYVRSWI